MINRNLGDFGERVAGRTNVARQRRTTAMRTNTGGHPLSKALVPIMAAVCVLLSLAACGGDSATTVTPARLNPAVQTQEPGPGTGTSTTTATTEGSEADRALAAALAAVDGVVTSDCPSQQKVCVKADPSYDGSLAGGIAVFNAGDPGGGGYHLILGRDPTGQWQFWLGTQQDLEPFALPGTMRICTGGSGLNVRASPAGDASVVASLPDETIASDEEFVLTEPGDASTLRKGNGWYRISGPVEGWVYARYTFSTKVTSDCAGLPN